MKSGHSLIAQFRVAQFRIAQFRIAQIYLRSSELRAQFASELCNIMLLCYYVLMMIFEGIEGMRVLRV